MKTKASLGKCLCEKIKIHVDEMNPSLGACHCDTCRKWSAGPFLAVQCNGIRIEGQDFMGIYNSSDWGERGFCKNCGSILFYRSKDHKFYSISSELFNTPEFTFETQIFIDRKPKYYEFANKTHTMTGAEVFAAFAPKE